MVGNTEAQHFLEGLHLATHRWRASGKPQRASGAEQKGCFFKLLHTLLLEHGPITGGKLFGPGE